MTEWANPLATNNPDLSAFKARGGRLIIWHGLADSLIFPQGTISYYTRVIDTLGGLGATRSFARLFLAPNVGHCGGGTGPAPADPFSAVVAWREHGVAPDTLLATLPAGQGPRRAGSDWACARRLGTSGA